MMDTYADSVLDEPVFARPDALPVSDDNGIGGEPAKLRLVLADDVGDPLVVGGGPAGFAAAVAAARAGSKVALVERYGSLGGIGLAGEAEFSRVIVADETPVSSEICAIGRSELLSRWQARRMRREVWYSRGASPVYSRKRLRKSE